MKKLAMNVEALRAQLTTSEQEVVTITSQLKAAKKAKRAYEKLIEALKEQNKATKKVVRATKKALTAIEEAEEIMDKQNFIEEKSAQVKQTEQPVAVVKEEPILFFTPEEEKEITYIENEMAKEVAEMENDEFLSEYRCKPIRTEYLERRQRRIK